MGFFSSIGNWFKDTMPALSSAVGFLADPVGSALGTIASSALDVGGKYLANDIIGIPNSQRAYDQSSAGALDAFRRNYAAYQSRYQDTMADMSKAGLNPILAASSGFNVGSSATGPAAQGYQPQVPAFDFASSAKGLSEAKVAEQNVEKTIAETKKLIADADVAIQGAKVQVEKIQETRAHAALLDKQETKTWQETINLEQEFLLKAKNISLMAEQIAKTGRETELVHEEKRLAQKRQAEVESHIRVMNMQAAEIKANLAQLQKTADAYNGPAGAILGYINAITNALNVNLGLTGVVPMGGFKKP